MKTTEKQNEETAAPKKIHNFLVRLPMPISERLVHQSERMSCSMTALAKMAFIKFLEEAEKEERKMTN